MSFPLFDTFFAEYYANPDENYLITAPTGSGKTHIAKKVLVESEPISVYVSPLKALSAEVYNSIRSKIDSTLIDSDVYEDDLHNVKGNVILTTYEKFDSAIRHNYRWLSKVRRVVIDEVHNVETDRGLAIENVVLWTKSRDLPIISLSATLHSPAKYLKWLNAKLISQDKRTVPLHECVAYPYTIKCGKWEEDLKPSRLSRPRYELLTLLLKKIVSQDRNALVFVKSRRSAESLAIELRRDGFRAQHYHSGMTQVDRRRALEMLINGELNVIVSTTALSQGVNLPVYAVIFYELKLPDVNERGEFKGWKDISTAQFRQMAGRAGRPGYDSEGMAVIITNSERSAIELENRYFHGQISSQYVKPDLSTLTLAFISWNQGIGTEEIENSLRSSYNYSQIELEEFTKTIKNLENLKLIENKKGVRTTSLGKAVALSYIDVKAFVGFPLDNNDIDLVSVILSSHEVAPSLRGCKEGKDLLTRWMNGESINEVCKKLSAKDINDVISNARWISFAMYRVMKALNDKRSEIAFDTYVRLKYGVPKEGINLVRNGIPRELAVHLLKIGIQSLRSLCVQIGFKEIREKVRDAGVQAELLCRKVYSSDLLVFDVRRAIQEFEGREFQVSDLIRKYGRRSLAELVSMGLLMRNGNKFILKKPSNKR
ncbi:MAG: helicase-related protein [Metallosphaera sp.]